MNKYNFKNLTPFKWFVLENFPFIEADFDALTEWQLFCKIGKEINKIINSENTLGMQMENVTNAFIDLQNYVNEKFDNLNLENEVNNKINEMVLNGTFESIVAKYIDKSYIKTYLTLQDLKNDTSLVSGNKCKTFGYNQAGDGGQGSYIIKENLLENEIENNGSIVLLNNGLYAVLTDGKINSKQFGILNNLDVTIQLQKFFDYAFNNIEKEIDFLGGNYIISDTININPYIKIKLIGDIYINDNNENEITFNIISMENEPQNDTQSTRCLFDNTNGTITLYNNKTEINKIAISINSIESTPAKRINSCIKGINIRRYKIGLSLNTFNTYILEMEKLVFFQCNVGLYVGKNVSVINSGENISFKQCIFTRCDCCMRFDSNIRCDFIQCSYDFNSCILYINNKNNNITFTRCWFEGIGLKTDENLSYYENFSGFIKALDSTQWYDKNYISIINCEICYLKGKHPPKLITGSTIDLLFIDNIFWYAEDKYRDATIGNDSFNIIFLTDNIKNVVTQNNLYKLTSHPFINKKLSLFNGMLENEVATPEYSNINNIDNSYFNNFDIVEIGTSSTKIRKTIIDNKMCIELTPPYNGASSKIKLSSKKFYPINNANRISINTALRGFKNNNNTRATFSAKLYDKDFNELITINCGSTWRTDETNINPLEFIQTYRNQDYNLYDIPKETVYIKPIFELFALNGSFQDTEIAGTIVHATDPVYFTAFYSFLE